MKIESTVITGLLIVIPILLTRYLLTSLLNKKAVRRAAFFPPTQGLEKPAYIVNIVTTLLLLVLPFFLRINLHGLMGIAGLGISLVSLILYGISIIHFARPEAGGINRSGLYAFSRNPMYVSFFLYFLGASMMTRSWLQLAVLTVFQVSVHFMILAEERWCRETFGYNFTDYQRRVRRYL
jgi:protein-S-isoprenylcysteine O-methyltransferase Ste14